MNYKRQLKINLKNDFLSLKKQIECTIQIDFKVSKRHKIKYLIILGFNQLIL